MTASASSCVCRAGMWKVVSGMGGFFQTPENMKLSLYKSREYNDGLERGSLALSIRVLKAGRPRRRQARLSVVFCPRAITAHRSCGVPQTPLSLAPRACPDLGALSLKGSS
jgi:hypothetical protein